MGRGPSRRGFSLVEILISIVIFSAVIMALAGLAFEVAKRSTRSTDSALIMGKLQSRVDLAANIRFDSLSLLVGCDTTLSASISVIGCTTVTPISARLSDVRVVVRTTVPGGRPDTVNLRRGKPGRPIPTL